MSARTDPSQKPESQPVQYWIPPVAAAAAIVPPFHGFVVKSAQQLGKEVPRFSLIEAVRGGLRASPTIGATVGTQMIAQNALKRRSGGEDNLQKKALTAAAVGFISSVPYAVFNGQTMGRTALEAFRAIKPREIGAITARETSFVGSIDASDNVARVLKRYFGDNKKTEYAGAFVSGVLGSTIGHPFDTAAIRWNNGLPVHLRHCMRGAPVKAIATGTFSTIYKIGKELLGAE